VDCGTETPREEMYGPPDELRCRACVQRRFPTTNVAAPHRSSVLRRWPPVTTFAVAAAVVVTLSYWSRVPQVRWLIAKDEAIWQGQLWRLLTSVFPHGDVLHLVFNLLWTWRFGKAVEQWMGSLRFLGFFVAAAVGPLAAEVLAGGSGIGLSGVGYALFGLLFALRHDESFAAEQVPPGVVQLFVGWFFVCILLTYFDVLPVANVAHGAGAVIGWLFGRAVLGRRPFLAVAGVGLLCVVLALATLYMPWNGYYDFHRGTQCFEQKDYACARKWYQFAAEKLTGADQEAALHNVRLAEAMLEEEKANGP
jgi:membrane associated rhomboid family serine protease